MLNQGLAHRSDRIGLLHELGEGGVVAGLTPTQHFEAGIEQRLDVAIASDGSVAAQHDRNQSVIVDHRGGGEVEARGVGKTGLQAV